VRIIDTHTHFPGALSGARPRPIEELREEFEKAGLCGAWLFTVNGLRKEAARNNDILAESTRGHRDFFVPFCTVSPHDGAEAAVKELERAHRALDMKGLKLHPWLQAFSLTHPAVLPILRKAGELGMPVLFHDGTPPYSAPLQIAAAAEKCPETTIILGHAGLDYLYNDAIIACNNLPNIYLCGCAVSSGYLRQIIENCNPDRLLFGSDGGSAENIIDYGIDKYLQLGLGEDILRRIFYDNPRRLLPQVDQHG
jgi:predicted TIM-barrel fold metal-dependent hydrolase